MGLESSCKKYVYVSRDVRLASLPFRDLKKVGRTELKSEESDYLKYLESIKCANFDRVYHLFMLYNSLRVR